MGVFVNPEEMQTKALVPSLKQMEARDLDDLFIIPAERRIEEAFGLDLDTDADPRWWAGRFDSDSRKRDNFRADMKRAVYCLVNRMAVNPSGFGTQTMRGSTVVFGKKMPEEVRSMMRRWSQPPRLYRV